ncbi:antibiotic biosynthesis monooxygenase [Desulfonema ishimotonii]|uniref:Antibiotic biosynthesis monooxygenase n=1 Tax=Desulfonema ishimotonii TaxID=45657 RepID=A0A401FUC7_9BACT|nr:putative quinol monooxygenase [Desulfonema ishimotonii]GBC60582.1 antibiotic biosynthesis monooxygenase [Desulfonema ishimotonii]
MGKIAVVATMIAKPGKEDALKQELLGLIEPSRADEGCLKYHLHQDQADPTVFVFYENWESKELLDAHLAQPHLKAFGEKAGELLAEPFGVRILDILA